jgi:hypothetical protein
MRILILAAALALPAGSSVAQPTASAPARDLGNPTKFSGARLDCVANRVQHAVQPWQKPAYNRLGELPPGDLHLAVMREVGGCQEPVIVRHDIGSPRAAPARPSR